MEERKSNNTVWWVVGILAALLMLLVICVGCALVGGLVVFGANVSDGPQYRGPAPERVVTVPAIPEWAPEVVPGSRPGAGALVLQVEPDSPADRLGLEAGDIIIAVNGRDLGPDLTLREALQDSEPGDTVSITWWVRTTREIRTASVELAADPDGTGNAYLGIEYRSLP